MVPAYLNPEVYENDYGTYIMFHPKDKTVWMEYGEMPPTMLPVHNNCAYAYFDKYADDAILGDDLPIYKLVARFPIRERD